MEEDIYTRATKIYLGQQLRIDPESITGIEYAKEWSGGFVIAVRYRTPKGGSKNTYTSDLSYENPVDMIRSCAEIAKGLE